MEPTKRDVQTLDIKLTDDQIKQLEDLTGIKMTTITVETEPFENPPLGTTVLGKVFNDPRKNVIHRINARFR